MTVAATLCARPSAWAQSPQQAGIQPTPPDLSSVELTLALIGAALSLLPGSAGADLSLVSPSGTLDGPRFVLDWPLQIPLRPRGFRTRTATFTNHRILLNPGMAIGTQYGSVPGESTLVTFHARAGYRLVYHPRGHFFGLLAGAGAAVEFWPWVRPGASMEAGLHLGAYCNEATAVVTLILRADAFFAGDNLLRLGASLGWAFY